MQRLSVFLFTSILGKKIYDEFDDVLGELKDIYVTTEQGYPRVIGYKVKRDGVTFHYEFRSIGFYSDDNKVKIMTRGSKEILPRTYSYLLSRNLLVYGLGGIIAPFICIKIIDVIIVALHIVS